MTVKDEIPVAVFELDDAEVDAVRYIDIHDLEALYRQRDETLVPVDLDGDVRSPSFTCISLLAIR